MVTSAQTLPYQDWEAEVSTVSTTLEEGRNRSSRNAEKHGLRAKAVVLRSEDSELFERTRAGLFEHFQPANIIEEALVDQIAVASWRMSRAALVEAAALNRQIGKQIEKHDQPSSAGDCEPPGAEDFAAAFGTLADSNLLEACHRLDTSSFRRFDRAMSLLRYLQKGRPASPTGDKCTNEP
jgi:hypothetical protein